MIFVNDRKIDFTEFPDGTSSLRFYTSASPCRILWQYDNDVECMRIYYLVRHIRAHGVKEITLELPYIPNARLDRVKNSDEVFTLKYFAEFINSLKFDKVKVLDAHSNVSLALIDNVEQMDVSHYIIYAIDWLAGHDVHPVLCFPDDGANKRYMEILSYAHKVNKLNHDLEHVHCTKDRDWRTGTIRSTDLNEPTKVNGRDVLIIDDICSKGGTFTYAAKALKAAGANNIFLYVTHCENTILQGKVLEDDLISRVFTTGSILRIEHEKITMCH